MIDQDAIDLLGHAAVEAPEPGLHVGHGQMELGRRQRAGQGRVRVAVDDDGVGRLLLEHALDRRQHGARLGAVEAAADPEVIVGHWEGELLEEDVRHPRVVVLPSVDEDLFVVLAELVTQRARLDELGPRAEDGGELH